MTQPTAALPVTEPSSTTWDVIVVGARCAGAATAMLLARAGLDVLLLDAARVGSDTLSTHALMRGGVIQLHRWGLLGEVTAAGTPAITSTQFHYGVDDQEMVEIRPTSSAPALYAPRRAVLDPILARAAVRAGAVLRPHTRVGGVLRDDRGAVAGVQWTDRRTGRPVQAHARLVIGADGRRSTIADLAGAETVSSGSHAGAVLLSYWSGLPRHTYQWFYGSGLTAGVIPTNDDMACVWIGMPAADFAGQPRPERLYETLLPSAAPGLDLTGARRHGPVRGFAGATGYVRRSSGPGWALVGDSGYFKDPITAHGQTDALRDAELLSRAVISAVGRAGLADALAEYEAIRNDLSSALSDLTDRIASYQWDPAEIRDLLPQLSRSMRPEVRALLGLDGDTTGQSPTEGALPALSGAG